VPVAGGLDAIAFRDEAVAQRQLKSGFIFNEQETGGGHEASSQAGWGGCAGALSSLRT
jgi:hypothetical protein